MTTTGNEPSRRMLVLRGSPDRDVAALAEAVAAELRTDGVLVDVATPAEVGGLAGYDGVVIGSTLRWWRWHPAAIRFLRRHAAVLRVRPLWLFQVDRHPHRAAAGALTGLDADRFPLLLRALLDDPTPVTIDARAEGRSAARRWARTIAASPTRTPIRPARPTSLLQQSSS